MSRGLISLLSLAVIVSACSDSDSNSDASVASSPAATDAPSSADATTTTSMPSTPTGGLVVPECNDVEFGSCVAGFVLDDGLFYSLSCSAVRNSAVSDEVIGEGDFEGRMVTVHTLREIPRTVMVAVSLPGGVCAEGDRVLSEWSMAFPQGAENGALIEAVCTAGELSAAQREANDC